jgi:Tol biopolymer transport system component
MRILELIIKLYLAVVILFGLLYSTAVYKDSLLSLGPRRQLEGRIVYSLKGRYIKVVELPSGRKRTIHAAPEEARRQLGMVSDPSFSPDGKKIVFTQGDWLFGDKLYIMNSDGTDPEEFLDLGEPGPSCPSWSPNGRIIAFILQRTNEEGLYLVNLEDPNHITQISNIHPAKSQPAWSPDGRRLAFISEQRFREYLGGGFSKETRDLDVYIVNLDGSGLRKIVDGASEVSWSPDGKRLAYEAIDGYHIIDIDDQYGYSDYHIVPYKTPFFGKGGSFPVRWSPDGRYIVYCKEIWPGLAGIYAISVDYPHREIKICTEREAIIGMSWTR